MSALGRSERVFIGVGTVLVTVSLTLLLTHASVISWFNTSTGKADGFSAAYSVSALIPETQPIKTKLSAVPQFGDEIPAPGVFLLEPKSTALMSWKQNSRLHSVRFQFEVYPRFTSSIFELSHQGKLILSKPVPGNGLGKYFFAVELSSPGSYQWQVRASETKSELRTFTLRR